jgi:hypothetical protein
LERWIPCTYVAITQNNDVVWSKLNPTFLHFVDDFLHYVTHLSKHFLHGGGWTWRLVMILLFSILGKVSSSVISSHISTTHGYLKWFSLLSSSLDSLS